MRIADFHSGPFVPVPNEGIFYAFYLHENSSQNILMHVYGIIKCNIVTKRTLEYHYRGLLVV